MIFYFINEARLVSISKSFFSLNVFRLLHGLFLINKVENIISL